jgi:hypothetical protein
MSSSALATPSAKGGSGDCARSRSCGQQRSARAGAAAARPRALIDEDGDCQNTRAEVLIVETRQPVTFTSAANCTVATGKWFDPYTGQTWTLASDVDVDHFVPLHNAHVSGGHAWDAAKKQAYANDMVDPDHLIAVEDNINQSKGASAPDTWKPPRTTYWCTYATDWAEVKKRWDLIVTQSEYDALADMLATC